MGIQPTTQHSYVKCSSKVAMNDERLYLEEGMVCIVWQGRVSRSATATTTMPFMCLTVKKDACMVVTCKCAGVKRSGQDVNLLFHLHLLFSRLASSQPHAAVVHSFSTDLSTSRELQNVDERFHSSWCSSTVVELHIHFL
jgi:hypothetical protein